MRRPITALIIFIASAGLLVAVEHQYVSPHPAHPIRTMTGAVDPQPPHHIVLASDAAEAEALAWANRMLAKVPDRMLQQNDDGSYNDDGSFEIDDVRQAFTDIANRYGHGPGVDEGLGLCALRVGDFEEAVSNFAAIAELSPNSPRFAADLADASERLRVSRALQSQIPAGEEILQLRRYPEPVPGKSWVALCRSDTTVDFPLSLRLLVEDGHRFRCVCIAKERGTDGVDPSQASKTASPRQNSPAEQMQPHPVPEQSFSGGSFIPEGAYMYVENLSGARIPQVLIEQTFSGSSGGPSRLAIFAWQDKTLARVLDAGSSSPIYVEDIKHNGTYQVWAAREIGGMCEALMPRWTDCYAWDGQQFSLANRQYPAAFRHWVPDLRQSLKDYPHDPEVLAHLAATYDILGRAEEAALAYRQAKRACQPGIDESGDLGEIAAAYRSAGRLNRARLFYRKAIRACDRQVKRDKDSMDVDIELGEAIRLRSELRHMETEA